MVIFQAFWFSTPIKSQLASHRYLYLAQIVLPSRAWSKRYIRICKHYIDLILFLSYTLSHHLRKTAATLFAAIFLPTQLTRQSSTLVTCRYSVQVRELAFFDRFILYLPFVYTSILIQILSIIRQKYFIYMYALLCHSIVYIGHLSKHQAYRLYIN